VTRASQRLLNERGAVLPIVAIWMGVLIIFSAFVIDVGNWFEHKRHLQMQVDAGALAGAGLYNACFGDIINGTTSGGASIIAKAQQYDGDPTYQGGGTQYNDQIGGGFPRTKVGYNSKTFPVGGPSADDTVAGSPCDAKMLDVKASEDTLPLFFAGIVKFFGNPLRPIVVNASARVEVHGIAGGQGTLPVGVPDVNPKIGQVQFLDEANNNAILATAPLTKQGISNGLEAWDNVPAPADVIVNSTRIGVRIIFSGGTSLTCGDPLVSCFDQILFVQGWTTSGNAAQPNAPITRDVTLVPGSTNGCSDAYFSSPATNCTVGVHAKVDFGVGASNPTLPNTPGAIVQATINGVTKTLTYDSVTGYWNSAAANQFSVPSQAGPLPVTLTWYEQSGNEGGNACKAGTGANNKCQGTFPVTLQRTFTASTGTSGPIQAATLTDSNGNPAYSFQVSSTTHHQLVVHVGIAATLKDASSINDPIVALRVVGGSQNQSLDCDPNYSNLWQELAFGCRPQYTENTGTACPNSVPSLWGSAQPWSCVAVQTGSATNQVPEGMNTRILGTDKPKTCPAAGALGHNNWSMFPDFPQGDPRIISVFLTPFGTFNGSGSTTVPVQLFAFFYVTGWTAQGGGFANPCQGNGDDPVPNNDPGTIVGHFIHYIDTLGNSTPDPQFCDFNGFGGCVVTLTK
jgi:hypothetical protein